LQYFHLQPFVTFVITIFIYHCEKQMGDRTSLTAIEYAPLRVQYWNTPAFPAALVDVE
jgi:hypothetical protein